MTVSVCVNRLPTALDRALTAFQTAGFDACGISFLDTCPIDVALHPAVTELDRYQHVIVTSPEAASQWVRAVEARWPQWPTGLTCWCVGEATAAYLPHHAVRIRCAEAPGSEPLIDMMRDVLTPEARCLVVTAADAGRQFRVLEASLSVPLDWLELYRLVAVKPDNLRACCACDHWVHGSAALLKACLEAVSEDGVSLASVTHCVTSDGAVALLPSGSRYYRIAAPQPEYVRLALEGEPCVKA